MSFHPAQDKFTVVSIFILRSYIEDDEFKKVLSQYGEIKREVIRLKYKVDLAFAGLVKVLLKNKTIPYLLRIGDEWCRLIHKDQHQFAASGMSLALQGKDALKRFVVFARKEVIFPIKEG